MCHVFLISPRDETSLQVWSWYDHPPWPATDTLRDLELWHFELVWLYHKDKLSYPPNNCPFAWGSGTHLIHASFGSLEPTTQTVFPSIGCAVYFLHRWSQSVPILYNGTPLRPQNCPFSWGMWTPSNTWFLGPTRILDPNGILIASAVFCRTHYCDSVSSTP